MSTAQEIEDAIRSLSPSERAKLLQHLPHILPEFAGDQEWDRIIVEKASVESWEVPQGFLDYDTEGNLAGIDIGHASRKLDLR